MKKLFAVIAALLLGFALASPLAHAAPPQRLTMILIGGHGDTTGNGIEGALRANGWISKSGQVNIIKIRYLADAAQGEASTAEGSTRIQDAYNRNNCGTAPCELHGVSGGTNAVIRASRALGLDPVPANTKVVLHASPNAWTGVWHSLNNRSFFDAFDPFSASYTVKEIPTQGMEHWYHQDDYVANKAPQCFNNAALLYMAAVSDSVHAVQQKGAPHDTWTGPDVKGVINHEFGAAASPLTVSGNSPAKPTCPVDENGNPLPWYR